MKAITIYNYGPPEVLRLEDVSIPEIGDSDILIEINCTAVNSGDWRVRKAQPALVRLFFGLRKPRIHILGTVFSGLVTKIGKKVTHFEVGDEVFGLSEDTMGTYAEYIALPEDGVIARKPAAISHEQAAAIVFGGHTALHFLKKAEVKDGDRVLVYGASGAVGTAAVQIAKYYGAHVSAVCSAANIEMVKSIGADAAIDYRSTNVYSLDERFDIIFESVNKTNTLRLGKLLRKGGRMILSAALIKGMMQGMWLSLTRKVKIIAGVAKATAADIAFLGKLCEEAHLKAVVDKKYPLKEMVAAHRYVEQGHKKGNVIVEIHT